MTLPPQTCMGQVIYHCEKYEEREAWRMRGHAYGHPTEWSLQHKTGTHRDSVYLSSASVMESRLMLEACSRKNGSSAGWVPSIVDTKDWHAPCSPCTSSLIAP